MLPLNRNLFSPLRGSFYRSGLIFSSILTLVVVGCAVKHATKKPSVEVTRIPDADAGGRPVLESIAGRVTGIDPDDRVVLFARSGNWYVQPFIDQP